MFRSVSSAWRAKLVLLSVMVPLTTTVAALPQRTGAADQTETARTSPAESVDLARVSDRRGANPLFVARERGQQG